MPARREVRSVLALLLPLFDGLRQAAEHELVITDNARRAADAQADAMRRRGLEIAREEAGVRAEIPGAAPADRTPGLVAARRNYLRALEQAAATARFELEHNERRLAHLAGEVAEVADELNLAEQRLQRTRRNLALLRLRAGRLRQGREDDDARELREMNRRVMGADRGGSDDRF